jgi:GT2 family glycosyltransferase
MASCLDSILNQTCRDFNIVVIDNDSADGTAEFIRQNYPMVSVVENNKNPGFAKANNQAIRLFKSSYLVFCNPDIVLEPTWLEKIMAEAESTDGREFGVIGGKLLKLKIINAEIGEFEKTDKIDSCGLKILKNHRVVELGAGEPSENFADRCEVFGFSGALVLVKRDALAEIVLEDKYHAGDFFDGNFFLYKEDVDLAWRLRLAGVKSLLVPQAVAYHLRTFAAGESQAAGEILAGRRKQSSLAKYYSYRNHLLILLEDIYFRNLLFYFFPIFWLELKKFGYILIFETKSLTAWVEAIKMLPEISAKRRQVIGQAKVGAKALRKWIS